MAEFESFCFETEPVQTQCPLGTPFDATSITILAGVGDPAPSKVLDWVVPGCIKEPPTTTVETASQRMQDGPKAIGWSAQLSKPGSSRKCIRVQMATTDHPGTGGFAIQSKFSYGCIRPDFVQGCLDPDAAAGPSAEVASTESTTELLSGSCCKRRRASSTRMIAQGASRSVTTRV